VMVCSVSAEEKPSPLTSDPKLDGINIFEDLARHANFELKARAEGQVLDVVGNKIIVSLIDGSKQSFLGDGATVYFVNGVKSELRDVRPGFSIFLYYVDDGGERVCDWVEAGR